MHKNPFANVNEFIKPALENTFRWNNMPEEERVKYRGEIIENVWQHTESCMMRAQSLVTTYPEILEYIDYKKLLQIILFHDAPEGFAQYGDVSQNDPERAKKKAENDEDKVFREIIAGKLGIPYSMYELYEGYEERNSVEGIIAKLIDRCDAREVWWNNLREDYRNNFLKGEKTFEMKLYEYSEFVIEKLSAIGKLDMGLSVILINFLSDLFMEEIKLLPKELQESEQLGIIRARSLLLQES